MTTVDPDLMLRLLRYLENAVDDLGWGQPARLFVLYDREDTLTYWAYHSTLGQIGGPQAHLGRYAAMQYAPPIYGKSGHYLMEHSGKLAWSTSDRAQTLRNILNLPGFLGVAFCFDGWATPEMSVAEAEEFVGAEKYTDGLDLPGGTQQRHLIAYDVEGSRRMYTITRLRGKNPKGFRDSLEGDVLTEKPKIIGGAVPECLDRIVAAVIGAPAVLVSYLPAGWTGQGAGRVAAVDVIEGVKVVTE